MCLAVPVASSYGLIMAETRQWPLRSGERNLVTCP